jgi:outer membrane protein insertion porin family
VVALAGCRSAPSLPQSTSGPWQLVVNGNRELSRDEIARLVQGDLEEFVRGRFETTHLDDAAFDLRKQYRARGFAFAEVAYRVETRGGVVIATLDVFEGTRATLEDVVIEGNFALPTDRLLASFQRGTVLKSVPFDRSAVEADLDAMIDTYRDEGFPDASATVDYVFSPDSTSVVARVVVREGSRQRIRDVSFEGVADVSLARLRAAARSFVDGPYSRAQLFRLRSAVLDVYASRGHPFVEVTDDSIVDRDTGIASVVLHVDEGPRSTVREVRIEGNEITDADVIRNRLRVGPGDAFDQTKIRDSQERLFATGLFESARLDVQKADPDGEAVDVVASVKERPPLFTDFRLGYGSFERARAGATFGTINLFGTGRRADVGVRVSTKSTRGEVTYTDPFFLGSDTQLQIKGFDERREEPSFSETRAGGTLTFSRQLFELVRGDFGYEFVNSNAFDLDPGIPEDEGPRVDIAGFRGGVTRDARDNPANPTSGSLLEFDHEISAFALGGDVNFYRAKVTAATFGELGPTTVLGGGMHLGTIWNFGNTRIVPIQERLFNGGESSVRSFKESELGPRDANGHPTGGLGSSTFSLELRQLVVDPVQVAFFVDAGNVTKHAEQFFLRGYRFALGTGLRIVTPVGPLRVDFGLNPNPRRDEDTYAVHISVGYAF